MLNGGNPDNGLKTARRSVGSLKNPTDSYLGVGCPVRSSKWMASRATRESPVELEMPGFISLHGTSVSCQCADA
jgi:hypothetical protein